jgi:superoxide reductase
VDNKLYRKYLKPGDKPEAVFNIADGSIIVREYCNLHGLWKA